MIKVVLASSSPRRRQLLEWAELKFDVLSRDTLEVYPPGMSKEEIPVYIARQKALEVQTMDLYQRYESHIPILAADTIVLLEGKIMGKPESKEEADLNAYRAIRKKT